MSSDSFDADLHGSDPVAEGRQLILMERLGHAGPAFEDAKARLAQSLSGAELSPVDEATGVFEVSLEAETRGKALQRVIDAMAAAGADDHLVIAERPEA